jgi:hypothetical protein
MSDLLSIYFSMKRITIRTLIKATACLSLVALTACSKSKSDPQPAPVPANSLGIRFSATTIAIEQVDSATIVLQKQGSQTQYFQRFDKGNGLLQVSVESLSAGEWTARMFIYTRAEKEDKGQGVRMYEQQKTFTLPLNGASIDLAAPTGKLTDSWKPFVFIRDNVNRISAFIPMDATDPAFQVIVADSKWSWFYVERSTHKYQGIGNLLLTTGTWTCTSGCFTHQNAIINNTAFIPFSQEAPTKNWDNGEVMVIVKNMETGMEKQYFSRYNK